MLPVARLGRRSADEVGRLALTATITLVVMVGLLYTLLGGPGSGNWPVGREEALAPAPPSLARACAPGLPASP